MFLQILMLLVIRIAFIETLVVPLTVAFIFCESNTPKKPSLVAQRKILEKSVRIKYFPYTPQRLFQDLL